MYGGEGTIDFFKKRTLGDEERGMGMGMWMRDGGWEMGSGSVRCGCQMCSTHGIKDEQQSTPMFVPFIACMVVRALSFCFKKRILDADEGGMGWLVEGEGWGWGWGVGDGRWGVVVLDVVARCVQHTE